MRVPVLRPLSLGEVLDTSFGIYRQLFAPLLLISVITQTLPLALGVFVESAGGLVQQPALWMLSLGLALVLGAVGTAASTFVVAETTAMLEGNGMDRIFAYGLHEFLTEFIAKNNKVTEALAESYNFY